MHSEEQSEIIVNTPAPSPASESSGAMFQTLLEKFTSLEHRLANVIERQQQRDELIESTLEALAKELYFIRQTQSVFAPKDTASQDVLAFAKEKIEALPRNEQSPAVLTAARDYAKNKEQEQRDQGAKMNRKRAKTAVFGCIKYTLCVRPKHLFSDKVSFRVFLSF